MKKDMHLKSYYYAVKCLSCNNVFNTISTSANVVVEICSKCHVFYTKGSYTDKKLGRIDRFYRRYKER